MLMGAKRFRQGKEVGECKQSTVTNGLKLVTKLIIANDNYYYNNAALAA
jgi:hypothetical protein